MGDPRNIAHAKKVVQEKHHKHMDVSKADAAASRPKKKAQTEKKKESIPESTTSRDEGGKPAQPADVAQLEKSLAVLSNLKDLEFHSRANIEKLAELSLTIEEELKQKQFAEALSAVYSAQDAFESKIAKLIEDYDAECTRLKPTG